MIDLKDYTMADYLNKTLDCECGKEHSASTKHVLICEEALHELPKLLSKNDFHKSFLIFDSTTYELTGEKLEQILHNAGHAFTSYQIPMPEPTPDEKTLGEILINFDRTCDHIIAIGSGTINDLSRFISYQLKLPYLIIATAPSMDGYASNVAPLIVNHMKTTFEAHVPFGIIADTNLLKDAPIKMIASGIGDILGKYTCLCDWKIAHLITGEYYCQTVENIVRKSMNTVVSNIDHAANRDPHAIKSIMEALVLTGIAMSYVGNSRPASGSEHHLSHYWEMMYLFDGKKPVLHGTKVGIGTVAVIKAYELLLTKKIDFNQAKEKAATYSKQNWETLMRDTYSLAAESVITLENDIGKNRPEAVITRITALQDNWNEVTNMIRQLPTADTIRGYLDSLKAPSNPISIGIDKTTFVNSFLVAKELRNRFGLLQLLYDLGLAEEIANELWEYFTQL